MTIRLLSRTEIRNLAKELDFRPRKSLGQNFVHDANTLRRVVSASGVNKNDHVLEVGPGLGSLTLALLDRGASVTAVEIDPVLAQRLPKTVADIDPALTGKMYGPEDGRFRLRSAAGGAPTLAALQPTADPAASAP